MLRSQGYPIVSNETLTVYMNQYLATEAGQQTAERFAAAGVAAYFMDHEIDFNDQIAAEVAEYLAANPPAAGQNATAAQVQQAVNAYLAMYPPAPGQTGATGPAGESVTPAQLAAAVAAYLQANPPQPGATGPAGQNATAEQVAQAVSAYVVTSAFTAQIAAAVAAYMAANNMKGPKGDKGDQGNPGTNGSNATAMVLVGNVAISQTAVVAIALGLRDVTTALAGTVVGERYLAFCRTYRVPATATNATAGQPVGYAIVDAKCNIAGQITVTLQAPLLAIGASYQLNCDIVRVVT